MDPKSDMAATNSCMLLIARMRRQDAIPVLRKSWSSPELAEERRINAVLYLQIAVGEDEISSERPASLCDDEAHKSYSAKSTNEEITQDLQYWEYVIKNAQSSGAGSGIIAAWAYACVQRQDTEFEGQVPFTGPWFSRMEHQRIAGAIA